MTKIGKKKLTGKSAPLLDTLAQLGTNPQITHDFDLKSCTTIDNEKALTKRARRKFMTHGLSLRLVDAAKTTDSEAQGYWNSFHCSAKLDVDAENRVRAKYCKNRWCMVCNSIRTAKLINQYKPTLATWKDKAFATATVPNCKAEDLRITIDAMHTAFVQIKDIFKKRNQRGTGAKLVGLRKLEVTYNPERDDYHPHYHFIFESAEMAKAFMKLWLKKFPEASEKAQDVRAADDDTVIEMFKYFTKVISKTSEGDRTIYADAMHIIFCHIKGKRVFQSYGFKPIKIVEEKTEEDKNAQQDIPVKAFTWNQEAANWIDMETGEVLTQFEPSEGLYNLIQKEIVVREIAGSAHDSIMRFRWKEFEQKERQKRRRKLKEDLKQVVSLKKQL